MNHVCLSAKLSQNSHQGYSAKNGGSYPCLDEFSPEIVLGWPEYKYEVAADRFVARYYDATIGRFISADTIVPQPFNPQSLNRYSYCLNNPLKYIDPTGHDGEETVWEQGTITLEDGTEIPHWYPVTNVSNDPVTQAVNRGDASIVAFAVPGVGVVVIVVAAVATTFMVLSGPGYIGYRMFQGDSFGEAVEAQQEAVGELVGDTLGFLDDTASAAWRYLTPWHDSSSNDNAAEQLNINEGNSASLPPGGPDWDDRPNSPKRLDDSYLKKNKINIHSFKEYYVGDASPRFDIYRDTSTNRLWLGTKDHEFWVETSKILLP